MKQEGNTQALSTELDGARQHIAELERTGGAHAHEVERLSQELLRREAGGAAAAAAGRPPSPSGLSASVEVGGWTGNLRAIEFES